MPRRICLSVNLVAMTWHAISDNGSLQYIQRSEQRRGSMPFVVVRHRSATSCLHRQVGLGSTQRLNLTFLIYTNDQCFIAGDSNTRAPRQSVFVNLFVRQNSSSFTQSVA
jgi:hypothetical protein